MPIKKCRQYQKNSLVFSKINSNTETAFHKEKVIISLQKIIFNFLYIKNICRTWSYYFCEVEGHLQQVFLKLVQCKKQGCGTRKFEDGSGSDIFS
jgi:hypothetical protein